MEIYRLKSFLAIMREGNLTRAAERLHLSQSALSSQLRQLEEELGLSLFRRNPRGMELSDAARELVPLVEAVLDSAERLRLRARALCAGGGETLTIGLNTDPGFLRIGAINRRLTSLHEELNVVFVANPTARTVQALHHGQVDLAFFYGTLDDPSIHQAQLAETRFCVVIPRALLRRELPLDWGEVAGLPWVWVEQDSPPYEAMRQQFEKRQLFPSQAVQALDEYIVKELVAAGQGVAVMRADEARPLLDEGKVIVWEKGWMELPLSLGWLARHNRTERVRAGRAAIEYLWRPPGEPLDDPLARINY